MHITISSETCFPFAPLPPVAWLPPAIPSSLEKRGETEASNRKIGPEELYKLCRVDRGGCLILTMRQWGACLSSQFAAVQYTRILKSPPPAGTIYYVHGKS